MNQEETDEVSEEGVWCVTKRTTGNF